MVERDAERKIHIRLTQDMHRQLRIRCAELDVTIQNYVVRMLDQVFAGETGQSKGSPQGAKAMNDIRDRNRQAGQGR